MASDIAGSARPVATRCAVQEALGANAPALPPLQPQLIYTEQGLLCTAASITLRHTEESGRRLPVRPEYQSARSLYRTMS